MTAEVEKLMEQLWRSADDSEEVGVFAVLDSARDETIYTHLKTATVERASLFRGQRAREMALVAPYVVELRQSDPFTNWTIQNAWDNSWGIFIQSTANFRLLKRHLQSLIQVFDEDGNPLFFRFYDPRVLRVYLPTCNSHELNMFFGPVSRFYLPDGEKNTLLCFQRVGNELEAISENGI